MNGEMILPNQQVPVRVVSAGGTDADGQVVTIMRGRKAKVSFEALVFFSLNPVALHQAVAQSHGIEVAVPNPIQFIVYGPTEVE